MSLVQIPCEKTTWMEIAGQWGKGNATVLFLALLLVLSGCQKYVIIVDVPVPPKVAFTSNIKEVQASEFEGQAECAADIKEGIDAKVNNSGYLVPAIPGLPDLDGPLEIKGKVSVCTLRMGYGVLNATMALWHGGKQLHQEVVKEETSRGGASMAEVRAVLVESVVNRFVKIFIPTVKRELREFRPDGANDSGWLAAKQGNWPLAIDSWTKRVKEDPKNHQAWYNRGVAQEANGHLPEAIKDYKQAVELKQDELYVSILSHAEKAQQATKIIETAKKSRE